MEEKLADMLSSAAKMMHWLGKYRECNALTLFSRYVRVHDLQTEAALREHVEKLEAR